MKGIRLCSINNQEYKFAKVFRGLVYSCRKVMVASANIIKFHQSRGTCVEQIRLSVFKFALQFVSSAKTPNEL